LKESISFHRPPEVEEPDNDELPGLWVPACPVPERLWHIYQGRGAALMVSSAHEAAQRDLAALRPPEGLNQELFDAYVAGILRQMPLMVEIDALASTGLTDLHALDFLAVRLTQPGDVTHDQIWRVLKRWLTYFLPTSYRLETGQEVLVRGKELSRR